MVLRWLYARRSLQSVVVVSLCGACGGSGDTKTAPTSEQQSPSLDESDPPAGSEGPPEPRSVCGDCPGLAGGESSDFGGGSAHACTAFEQPQSITATRAAELGFDMERLVSLIERDIDAPLRWSANDALGGPPTGYEQETRIEAKPRLGDWITYFSLDPERCTGTSCSDDDYGDWTCSDRLELGIDVELRTLDGAVNAQASGYVLQGREGFPFGDRAAGSQQANLRDVRGSLQLSPPAGSALERAVLSIDLFFEPEQTEGDLHLYLWFREDAVRRSLYEPLHGHWPDVPMPPDEPAQASPELEP